MSCYSGGEQFLKPAGTGICGYNCTLRKTADPSGHYCTNVNDPGCLLFCNTLGWGWNITAPMAAGAGAAILTHAPGAAPTTAPPAAGGPATALEL